MELNPQRALDYFKTISRKPIEKIPMDVLLFGDYKLQGGKGYYSYLGTNPCLWELYLDLYGIKALAFRDYTFSCRWDLKWDLLDDWHSMENRGGHSLALQLWDGGKREFKDFFSEIK